MSRICTLEGPFDYQSDKRSKLSALFNVNDFYGQQVFGGRWPLVKMAACKIATDAIDSPFMFQIRNLTRPEAADLDPVLCRIWGPNEAAGEALLGRPCWGTLKGCLGALSDFKTRGVVVPKWGAFDDPILTFDTRMQQEKMRNPMLTDGEAAVITYFSMIAEVPKPSEDAGDGYYFDKEHMINEGPMPLSMIWERKRVDLVYHIKDLGLWDYVKKAAAARQGAIASAAAAQSTTAMQDEYRGISFDFYPMDASKISDEVVREAEIRVQEEKKQSDSEESKISKYILPLLAVGGALFAFS